MCLPACSDDGADGGDDDVRLAQGRRLLDVVRAVACDGVDAVVGEAGFGVLGLEEALVQGRASMAENDQWQMAERGDGRGLRERGAEVDSLPGAFARKVPQRVRRQVGERR